MTSDRRVDESSTGFGMERAFILHRRPYTDSRSILELLTSESGRVAALIRSSRKKYTSQQTLFTLYEVQWRGKSDLKTLTVCEGQGLQFSLKGAALLCGLYINELLLRVIPPADPCPLIFAEYEAVLKELTETQTMPEIEPVLRRFEISLLSQLGFGVDFARSHAPDEPIDPEAVYYLDIEGGFVKMERGLPQPSFFLGADILAVGAFSFTSSGPLRAAKRMTRQMLAPLVGSRPLKSRELFI